jgi:transposase
MTRYHVCREWTVRADRRGVHEDRAATAVDGAAARRAVGDHRQVINGILFRVRSGVPWRDVPERYGPWKTLYKRFARWEADGTWARIEAVLQTDADAAGELDRNAHADSTVVRAHQHAAGARKGG